jgi:hypothetical protein
MDTWIARHDTVELSSALLQKVQPEDKPNYHQMFRRDQKSFHYRNAIHGYIKRVKTTIQSVQNYCSLEHLAKFVFSILNKLLRLLSVVSQNKKVGYVKKTKK